MATAATAEAFAAGLSGGAASILAKFVVYPGDVLKTVLVVRGFRGRAKSQSIPRSRCDCVSPQSFSRGEALCLSVAPLEEGAGSVRCGGLGAKEDLG